jgi:hypothetical protein
VEIIRTDDRRRANDNCIQPIRHGALDRQRARALEQSYAP